ncbi:MAG TPA: lauroyl acyltransferase [Beijerinckiaceae bacterium]|nr:lauroyl acyltransferase [Beijerinckiaceae bacterium]
MRLDWINLRHRIEYALFCFAAALFSTLSVETSSNLSGNLWRLVAPRLRRHRRALAHLQQAYPDKSETECDAIARDMWENLGRVFAEAFHLREFLTSERIVLEDEAYWLPKIGPGKASVVCAAHQGNWELASIGLLRAKLEPTGVYQKITNPYVDRRLLEMRKPFYPGGLFEKRPAAAMEILRYARAGGTVAFLADLRERNGVQVPFFGRPAPSTPFPAFVARMLDIPLLAARIVREPGVHFRLSVERVDVPKTNDRNADVLAATANLHAAFERSIREKPEQWMWAHRRWG